MLLEVGRVVRPHGVRGQVVVELSSNRTQRIAAGSRLTSDKGDLLVLGASPHRGRWRVSFEGVSDHAAAESLRGTVLLAPPLEEAGTLWVHELVGSEVLDTGGVSLGRVAAVEANPASDLLVLDGGGLVPLGFVREASPGRLVVEVPEGLLG